MQRPVLRRLSEHVVDLIAAGEVIERPAAALKELVENALDAGATRIDVSLQEGGCAHIEVVDNGCGMTAEELPLALERHCTSKLEDDQLVRIRSLGFRGEALPSIAASARLSVTSRIAESDHAWCLRVEGGKSFPLTPAAGRVGTIVSVSDLFFATPARRKFLKTARIEAGHADSVMRRLALSAPHCAFSLKNDGRTLMTLPVQNLKERVASILGVPSDLLLEFDEQRTLSYGGLTGGEADSDEGRVMRLQGFLCGPGQTRATGAGQFMLVNHRPVTDPLLRTAIRVAYRPVIERGRFPLLYLHLTMPLERVDVNVHPAKTELRFADEAAVKSLVIGAIGRALSGGAADGGGVVARLAPRSAALSPARSDPKAAEDAVPSLSPRVGQGEAIWGEDKDFGFGASVRHYPSLPKASVSQTNQAGLDGFSGFAERSRPYKAAARLEDIAPVSGVEPSGLAVRGAISDEEKYDAGRCDGDKHRSGDQVLGVPIGQIHATYILSIAPDGDLVLVDQHAAHERLTYERLRTRLERGKLPAQALLMPEVIELPPAEYDSVLSCREELACLGMEIESFGAQTLLLRTIPVPLVGGDYRALLRDIAEEISQDPDLCVKQTESFAQRFDSVVARMACHGSVRAGRVLEQEEMIALLRQVEQYPRANTCPHGRPTWLRLTRDELEKLFGRTK